MFCGPIKNCIYCQDRRCPLCRSIRWQIIRVLVGAAALLTIVVFMLVTMVGCGPELGARPCEALKHRDSTGHLVLCDCTCADDPRFACPVDVVECTRPELEERPWYESSGSDGGSSDGA